jgi:hypothetical protein
LVDRSLSAQFLFSASINPSFRSFVSPFTPSSFARARRSLPRALSVNHRARARFLSWSVAHALPFSPPLTFSCSLVDLFTRSFSLSVCRSFGCARALSRSLSFSLVFFRFLSFSPSLSSLWSHHPYAQPFLAARVFFALLHNPCAVLHRCLCSCTGWWPTAPPLLMPWHRAVAFAYFLAASEIVRPGRISHHRAAKRFNSWQARMLRS